MKKYLSYIYWHTLYILFYAQDSIQKILTDHKYSNSVAFIRTDGLGDLFLWQWTGRYLKDFYKNKKIYLIVNVHWAGYAQQIPYWDEIIPVDTLRLRQSPFYRWRTFQLIASKGFSVVVNPIFSRDFLVSDSIARASGAKSRIASPSCSLGLNPYLRKISNSWYTKLIKYNDLLIMEIDKNIDFLNILTNSINKHQPSDLTDNYYEPEHLKHSDSLDDYMCFVPKGSIEERNWSVNKYIEVVEYIITHSSLYILVCGERSSRSIAKELILKFGSDRIIDMTGRTTVLEYISIIKDSKFVLATDSSAVHIAASMNIPSVAILGGGHYGRFLPYSKSFSGPHPLCAYEHMECYNCDWECSIPRKKGEPFPCITGVSVSKVVKNVDQILKDLKPHKNRENIL